ncbi:MAG: PDDEXK nuclease domain-containing protein [Candidatus Cloacimonetes bacterium]|nr:PDDEXK nuclease domain-containing protein [Candidatus Cloacimonadota bacterium]
MSDFLKIDSSNFYVKITKLLKEARKIVVQNVNHTMVLTYYEIGRMIVEEEQGGQKRAGYGKHLLKGLSKRLSSEFGRGFSKRNLEQMRQFFLIYSKTQTVSAEFKLSWSHYLKLMRISDENERKFYEIETAENNWSLRELQRQFDSALFQRLVLSRDKVKVKELSVKGQIVTTAQDSLKDPYILEFIGLPEKSTYSETKLEQKIIDKLEHFLLELGKGYAFIGRQERFTFNEKHFRVDLVFYNRILQCFVLIDLKIGEIKHQDLGQMQMYVNYYDRFVKLDNENKTIGIILCREKDNMLVEITLPKNNDQIFASKYQTILPSKEELKHLIENKENNEELDPQSDEW